MSDLKAQKTLTIKSMGINIPVGGGDFLGKTVLAVTGVIDGYFMKNTNYGESICLTGDLVVANLISGEMFEGSQIYLPDDYAQKAAKALDSEAGTVITLDEPLQIAVAQSDKAGRGYTYVVRKLQTIEAVNKKKQLAEMLMAKVAALPAPTAEKPEPVKAKKSA